MDAVVEGRRRAHEGLERERGRHDRHLEHPSRLGDRETAAGRHQVRAVDQREALLLGQLDGLEAGAAQRVAAGHALALEEGLALADQHEREVCERREIARAADGSLRGDDRPHVAREQRPEQLDQLDAHARVAAPQRLGEQEEHAAHGVVCERLARADGVRADEVALQGARVRRVDAHAGEAAEAGREAVHRLTGGHEVLDRGASALDARALVAVELGRRAAAGDGLERGQGRHGHRCYWKGRGRVRPGATVRTR